MTGRALITGGAGFIGSHLADRLLERGWAVRALDALLPQVHGEARERPAYLDPRVELMVGDVRNPAVLRRALEGADVVVHLAARVGVGQSMYEIAEYVNTNVGGTALLLEMLSHRRGRVRRLVVASSMSLYGEGLYVDAHGRWHERASRTVEQLRRGDWEAHGEGGERLEPIPTPESKEASLSSVYALTKFDQERLGLMLGAAYGIPTVALRFFNVYGPRQALSNPYTGVLAIFAARLLNGARPLIYEDGRQRRDFVHVTDVARACVRAVEVEGASGAYNVASGESCSVLRLARRLAQVLGRADLEPEITGKHRVGDIRHCFADITRARAELGYEPRVALEDGLAETARWLAGEVAQDRVMEAGAELASRGLTY